VLTEQQLPSILSIKKHKYPFAYQILASILLFLLRLLSKATFPICLSCADKRRLSKFWTPQFGYLCFHLFEHKANLQLLDQSLNSGWSVHPIMAHCNKLKNHRTYFGT